MVATVEYEKYKERNAAAIKKLLGEMGCRPVLFVGSGLSKRYLGGPSWMELLKVVASKAKIDDERFAFLAQKANNDPAVLGSILSDEIHTWAWSKGKSQFPAEYFEAGSDKSAFIKHICAEYLKSLVGELKKAKGSISKEIQLFKSVAPHAIITTNFDTLVEEAYPDFELVVGEKIIPFSMSITGETYKIHGTVNEPDSIILTSEDYDRFMQKRRYITSKMMTYFAEYPVFIFGYSLTDKNVSAIISDLGEAMKDKGGLLENVFYVEWVDDVEPLVTLAEEHAIAVGQGALPSLRVRTIVTSDFDWIFEALGDTASPVSMPTKTLRHLAARVVELVRVDVPKNKVEIDFAQVERLSENPDELASVLGISNVKNPNIHYPYSLTQVGRKLGFSSWHKANELLKKASVSLGYDLKESDNDYHMAFKAGTKMVYHKYSEAAVELLKGLK